MKNNTNVKLKNLLGKRNVVFYILIVLGVLNSLLMVGMALSIKLLVNAYEYNLGNSEVINSAIILVAIVVASFLIGILNRLISSRYTSDVEEKLKSKVFKSFLSGSFNEISSNKSGELISKFSVDALRVANVYANLPSSVISTFTHLLGILVALFILEPTFTLIVAVLGILAIIVTLFLRKFLVKLYKKVRSKDAGVSSYIGEVSKNSLVVKALNVEDSVLDIFNGKVIDYKNSKLSHSYLGAIITSITAFTFTLFYAISVIMGVNGMANGMSGIDFGVIIAVLQLITQIKSPINNLTTYVTIYNETLISAERLFTIAYDSDDKLEEYESGFESISIKNLDYSYEDKVVLKGVNLTVNKGDKVLIKGTSGEGKSTLLKAIMGLYKTPFVEILINGKKIAPNKIKGVYSYVPQDNELFSGTVKENITFNKEYNLEKINEVLDLACIDFLSLDGLDSYIGENGLNLSIGQGQRIAIARALIKQAPVLILDEATSSLDEKTEEEVLSKITSIKDLTIISISHRPAFSKFASKVYNLSGGLLTALDNSEKKDA